MRIKGLLLLTVSAFLLLYSCQPKTTSNEYDRPTAPWVFRSVLDSIPRIVTVALHDDLWVAYSAQNGSLYRMWKGYVDFTGAVYNTQHGPQPMVVGDIYFENEIEQPWSVVQNGKTTPVKAAEYKGHRYVNGQAEIFFDLFPENGQPIRVNERPEYIRNEAGQGGFERVFTVEGLPDGASLVYETNISSIAYPEMVKTDGKFEQVNTSPREHKKVKGIDLVGKLTLNTDRPTRLAAYLTRPLIPNSYNPNAKDGEEITAENQVIHPGYTAMAKSDCKVCHNAQKKTIGPSYMQIAQRYDQNEENMVYLIGKVKNGGAGVWGETVMSAHPNLDTADIRQMIAYIMEMDAEEETAKKEEQAEGKTAQQMPAITNVSKDQLLPGLLMKFKTSNKGLNKMADLSFNTPDWEMITSKISIMPTDFHWLEGNYGAQYTGYLDIPKTENYVLRIGSDDGSMLYVDGKLVADNDGLHGTENVDADLYLEEGLHEIKIEFFQGLGGVTLYLQWKTPDSKGFEPVPGDVMFHHREQQEPRPALAPPAIVTLPKIPGDGSSLEDVHPSYDLSQARPIEFTPKVGGIDFLKDGRMVVSVWDPTGSVYLLDGVETGDPSQISTKQIASGLAEPLGVKVVGDELYVLQKQELTRLIDNDGDDIIDEYQTFCNDWLVSANFHEFCFGLAYKDEHFYATLATAINPGGASTNPQIPDRGKVVKISKKDGSREFVASGLRTPNGVGVGAFDEVYVADNQGDWLPASKIVHVKKDAWYGSRSVDFEGTANRKETKPVVWLPQNEIGNSPSQPLAINDGPYKGQMIHGEVTHGGLKRVFVEEVDGQYQGAVFRFTQGLEAGVNRIQWGPDGALYIGGIGSTGNWGHTGKLWYGLQRFKYNGKSTFEPLTIKAHSNGIEIAFTEALAHGQGWDAESYLIQQFYFLPTEEYGGPKMDLRDLPIQSVNVSEDRKKVFLELGGMKEDHVIYLRIIDGLISENGNGLWTTEGWYTMNKIPQNKPGFQTNRPDDVAPNILTEAEKKAGWKLLFDGKSTAGWRNYGKETVGSSWKIDNGALMLDVVKREEGTGTYAKDGGDIMTDEEFENFELRLEWKISNCGNSGIFYNVVESDEFDAVWQSAHEMQVLDNTCHPDSRFPTHRAGDLYDLIECKYETVKPAGKWNKVRVIVNNGKVEHWLNGKKVVEYEMWTDEWKEMIANSKFRDWKGFGQAKKGRIALQDHDDRVWYRNIKIKELGKTEL